ncbi:MAG: hypothetical protein LUF87_00655 [Alistipes sp.]|nr:hypothetical protein [Alistipes sp.]
MVPLKKNRLPILLLALLYVWSPGFGQSAEERFLRQLHNIPSRHYLGDIQVWNIISSSNGNIFAATAKGISIFDGVRWTLCTAGNDPLFRCLYYDRSDDVIYAAADNEFGRLLRNKYGGYDYTAIFKSTSIVPDIFWRIDKADGRVLFQTHQRIMSYDPANGKIREEFAAEEIGYLLRCGNGLFLQSGSGLYTYENDRFAPTGLEFPSRIVEMVPHGPQLLVMTEDAGLYVINDKWTAITPADAALNRILSTARIFSAGNTAGGHLLLGTVMDGLFILDNELNVVSHFGNDSQLRYSTVLSVHCTAMDEIWLGLDGGMAKITSDDPLHILSNKSGDIGSVYDIVVVDGELYAGTNKGVFLLSDNGGFGLVEGTQGQVWKFVQAGGLLLVCHDTGLLVIRDGAAVEASTDKIWTMKPVPGDGGLWLSADRKGGFSIYRIGAGVEYHKKVGGYDGAHTDMKFDRYGNLWVQDREGSAVRLKLNNDLDISGFNIYPIPGEYEILRADLDSDVVFHNGEQAYLFDISADSLAVDTHFTQLFETMQFRPLSVTQVKDLFFYMNRDRVGLIRREGTEFIDYGIVFESREEEVLSSFGRRIVALDRHTVALGLNNSVMLYNHSLNERQYLSVKIPLLCGAAYVDGAEEKQLEFYPDGIIKVPYGKGYLRLYLTDLYHNTQIVYSVDGGEEQIANADPYLDIRLKGSGTKQVLLRNLGVSSTDHRGTALTFRVERPWFMAWWFMVLCAVTALGIYYLLAFIYKKTLARQKKVLLRRQQWLLEKEKREHEIEMLGYKLREREKKLMNVTMNGIQRNSMLSEIKKELAQFDSKNPAAFANKVAVISRRIDGYMNDDENRELFEKYFNSIYDGFFDRLRAKYPTISPGELKLSAYVKLNLSNKEIATYMNITVASVEIARHRLRRKFGLPQGVSLHSFISSL